MYLYIFSRSGTPVSDNVKAVQGDGYVATSIVTAADMKIMNRNIDESW